MTCFASSKSSSVPKESALAPFSSLRIDSFPVLLPPRNCLGLFSVLSSSNCDKKAVLMALVCDARAAQRRNCLMKKMVNKLSKNWNNILRWIHLIFGFCFSIYFGAITFNNDINFWDDEPWVTMAMGTVVLGIVFWTGIIKWQLPRIKKWNRNRNKNRR